MLKIKRISTTILLVLLVFTRLINIDWGMPYPFHPDERNMAVAVQQLSCCLNPHFFAYGQPPLYLAWGLISLSHFMTGKTAISLEEAIISLRLISAVFSILTVLILLKILTLFYSSKKDDLQIPLLLFIFAPFFIQFAHFGTTESALMFFYVWLTYIELLFIKQKISFIKSNIMTGVITGMAISFKVSSVIFLILPVYVLFLTPIKRLIKVKGLIILISCTAFFSLIFSLQSIISFSEFINSIQYESQVGLGKIIPFYTRQFEYSIPIIFQFLKIYPYALGIPVLVLFVIGFVVLPKTKEWQLLRVATIIVFLPNAFLFAKWTRFMAPTFPLILLLAVLVLLHFKERIHKTIFYLIVLIAILPGVAFLSVYLKEDVRSVASRWMISNIAKGATVLSETGNVVDIPLYPASFRPISFDFYDLDQSPTLKSQLAQILNNTDYIVIPSRRIINNHTCVENSPAFELQRCEKLRNQYPVLNDYYDKLLKGTLGFQKVAEFSSFPGLSLFGQSIVEVNDEKAEETFTVFDHPVIRIYKRT